MLQPPTLDENLIVRALAEDYDLRVTELAFLPLGADANTAVYKAAAGGAQYFIKLRSGAFDSISVEVPAALHAQGIAEVMTPAATVSGSLWVDVSVYRLMLYPFVEGRNGYERDLSDAQWRALGAAMRAVHTATLPDALLPRIPRESYPPLARDMVRAFMAQSALRVIHDAAAARLDQILWEQREAIAHVILRAERLAAQLQEQPREFVLCHTDIHAGNTLLSDDGALHIVDWDNPLLAPKERDLMYIGAWGAWRDPRSIALFYEGYSAVAVDQAALAYYRYEHFVQDLCEWCKLLFHSPNGGEDRAQAIYFLEQQIAPGNDVDIARATDPMPHS